MLLLAAVTGTYPILYGCWYDWSGCLALGPRFLVPLVPPWLALAGRALRPPGQLPRGLLFGLSSLGVAVQVVGVALHPQWMNYRQSD